MATVENTYVNKSEPYEPAYVLRKLGKSQSNANIEMVEDLIDTYKKEKGEARTNRDDFIEWIKENYDVDTLFED
jgi:hypothetical protein